VKFLENTYIIKKQILPFGQYMRKILMIKKNFKTPLLKCIKLQVSNVFKHKWVVDGELTKFFSKIFGLNPNIKDQDAFLIEEFRRKLKYGSTRQRCSGQLSFCFNILVFYYILGWLF
jgi:hypothetical protein